MRLWKIRHCEVEHRPRENPFSSKGRLARAAKATAKPPGTFAVALLVGAACRPPQMCLVQSWWLRHGHGNLGVAAAGALSACLHGKGEHEAVAGLRVGGYDKSGAHRAFLP